MNDNHIKINLQPQHAVQAGKRGLLLRTIIFIAWIIALGLFISFVACHQNETVIFIIKVGIL